jgi:hypothetical protein
MVVGAQVKELGAWLTELLSVLEHYWTVRILYMFFTSPFFSKKKLLRICYFGER